MCGVGALKREGSESNCAEFTHHMYYGHSVALYESPALLKVFYDYPFTVPSYFALITRALITLEGIALTGDPSFDLFRSTYPFARRKAVLVLGVNGIGTVLKNSPISVSQLLLM